MLSHVGTPEGALVRETSLVGQERERLIKAHQTRTLSPTPGEGASLITQDGLLRLPVTVAPDASEARGQAGCMVRGNLLDITGHGRTSAIRVASAVVLQ